MNNKDDFLADAWRALAGQNGEAGWQTISILDGATFQFMAGRDFPDDKEAILVGFSTNLRVQARQLPQGQGFELSKINFANSPYDIWLALSRTEAGGIELFETMALDLVDILRMSDGHAGSQLPSFLKRIEAWQRFMQRDRDSLLSLEAEVGLFGELLVLREICGSTGSPVEAIECWQGPSGGVQDFHLADGAIEVKSTISATSFPAKIHGIAQLDDAIRQPLYLAGVRLQLEDSGMTLPELAEDLERKFFAGEPLYRTKLLMAGLYQNDEAGYTRRFESRSSFAVLVSDNFPRLIRGNIPSAITEAYYELDLASAGLEQISVVDAIKHLKAS